MQAHKSRSGSTLAYLGVDLAKLVFVRPLSEVHISAEPNAFTRRAVSDIVTSHDPPWGQRSLDDALTGCLPLTTLIADTESQIGDGVRGILAHSCRLSGTSFHLVMGLPASELLISERNARGGGVSCSNSSVRNDAITHTPAYPAVMALRKR